MKCLSYINSQNAHTKKYRHLSHRRCKTCQVITMCDLSGLQNFQCFALTRWSESQIPWRHLDNILGNGIMTFNHNLSAFHESLHEHGNGVFNFLIEEMRKSDILSCVQHLEEPSLNIKYRFLWLSVKDFDLVVLERGAEWFSSRALCEEKARQNVNVK